MPDDQDELRELLTTLPACGFGWKDGARALSLLLERVVALETWQMAFRSIPLGEINATITRLYRETAADPHPPRDTEREALPPVDSADEAVVDRLKVAATGGVHPVARASTIRAAMVAAVRAYLLRLDDAHVWRDGQHADRFIADIESGTWTPPGVPAAPIDQEPAKLDLRTALLVEMGQACVDWASDNPTLLEEPSGSCHLCHRETDGSHEEDCLVGKYLRTSASPSGPMSAIDILTADRDEWKKRALALEAATTKLRADDILIADRAWAEARWSAAAEQQQPRNDPLEAAGRYRKRPIVVSAVQWFPGKEVPGVVSGAVARPTVMTLEGPIWVSPGDWIITGVKGETYPCKPDIFAATYEPVERQAAETQVFVGTARRREVGDLLKEALIKERDDYRARAIAAEEALAELTAEAKTAWSFIRLYEQAPDKYRAAHADALWKAIEAAAAVATAKQSAPTVETRAFDGIAVEHTNGISNPWWCIDETCDANWFSGLDGRGVRLTVEVLETPASGKDGGT